MVRKFIVFILISTIIQSCHPLFCGWEIGYKQLTQVENEQIVGEYTLSKKSKEYLESKGFSKSPKLKILESGRYEFIDIPEFVFDSFGNEQNKSITNLSDKWSISCDPSYDCLIELYNVCVVAITENENGIISIPITIGDGDMCNGIVFERAE